MSALVTLTILLLAVGLLVGVVKPRSIGKLVVGLLFIPPLLLAALVVGRSAFAGLSLPAQILFVATALPVGLAVLLRLVLPRDVWAGIVSSFLYDLLRHLFGLPVRLVRWLYLFRN